MPVQVYAHSSCKKKIMHLEKHIIFISFGEMAHIQSILNALNSCQCYQDNAGTFKLHIYHAC